MGKEDIPLRCYWARNPPSAGRVPNRRGGSAKQEEIPHVRSRPKTIRSLSYALLRPVQKMASQGCGQGGNSGQPFRPKFAHIVRVLGGSYPLRAIPSMQEIQYLLD